MPLKDKIKNIWVIINKHFLMPFFLSVFFSLIIIYIFKLKFLYLSLSFILYTGLIFGFLAFFFWFKKLKEDNKIRKIIIEFCLPLFLITLILITLLSFDLSFINRLNLSKNIDLILFFIAIFTGFITFYSNKEQVEKEIKKERISEEKTEDKKYNEFENKFPRINRIWVLKNIVRWMYKEELWYSSSVVLLIIVGFFIRLYHLGKLSLWGDEGTVYIVVKNIISSGLPYLETGLLYTRDIPHLYLTAFSLLIFGPNELALRLPSLLAGTGLIIITYMFFKEIFSKKISIILSLAMATSPWMIEYSRISRSYILVTLFLFIACFFLLKYLKYSNKKNIILFTLFSILACLTHQTGQIVLLTSLPLFLVLINKKNNMKRKLHRLSVFIVTYLTIFSSILLYKYLFGISFYTLAEERIVTAEKLSFFDSIFKYIPFSIHPNLSNLNLFADIFPIIWPLTLITLIISIFLIKKYSDEKKFLIILTTTFILSIVFSLKPVTINRAVLFIFPFILFSLGLIIENIILLTKNNRIRKIILTIIFIMILFFNLYPVAKIISADYGDPINPHYSFFEGWIFRQDHKTTYEYVNKHYQEGDMIIVYGIERFAVFYSTHKINYRVWSSDTTATIDSINLYSGIKEIKTIEQIKGILDTNKRVWVITNYSILSRTEKAPRIFHLSNVIINHLDTYKLDVVYQSKDPSARVYLIKK